MATTSTLTPTTQTFYQKRILERLVPNFRFYDHCEKFPLPQNSGRTMSFRRYSDLSAATTPLAETTYSAAGTVSSTEITTAINEYGYHVIISGMVSTTDIDPNVKKAVEDVLATQMSNTLDTLVRDEMSSTSQSQFAGGKATGTMSASDKLTAAELRLALRNLRAANVRPFEGQKYHAIVSPLQTYDLKADSGVGSWMELNKYTTSDVLKNGNNAGMVGSIDGADIFESTLVKTATHNTITCYEAQVTGADSYGVIEVGPKNTSVIVMPAGSSGINDPLARLCSVGWLSRFAVKSLDATAASSKNARSIKVITAVSA